MLIKKGVVKWENLMQGEKGKLVLSFSPSLVPSGHELSFSFISCPDWETAQLGKKHTVSFLNFTACVLRRETIWYIVHLVSHSLWMRFQSAFQNQVELTCEFGSCRKRRKSDSNDQVELCLRHISKACTPVISPTLSSNDLKM